MLRKVIFSVCAALALLVGAQAAAPASATIGWVGALQSCNKTMGAVDVTIKWIGMNPYAPTYVDVSGDNNGFAPGTFSSIPVNPGVSFVTVTGIPGNSLLYVRLNQPLGRNVWDATETFYLITDGHCAMGGGSSYSTGGVSYSSPSLAGFFAGSAFGSYGYVNNRGELDRFVQNAIAATYGPHPPGHPKVATYPGIIPGVGAAPGFAGNVDCEPSYATFCLPVDQADLDCLQLFIFEFPVTGSDPHNFDLNDDGIGCALIDII